MLEVSKKIIKATFLIYNDLGPVVKKNIVSCDRDTNVFIQVLAYTKVYAQLLFIQTFKFSHGSV